MSEQGFNLALARLHRLLVGREKFQQRELQKRSSGTRCSQRKEQNRPTAKETSADIEESRAKHGKTIKALATASICRIGGKWGDTQSVFVRRGLQQRVAVVHVKLVSPHPKKPRRESGSLAAAIGHEARDPHDTRVRVDNL